MKTLVVRFGFVYMASFKEQSNSPIRKISMERVFTILATITKIMYYRDSDNEDHVLSWFRRHMPALLDLRFEEELMISQVGSMFFAKLMEKFWESGS